VALSTRTRLGPYEILEPLGAGGMGEVYRARDPRLKREVALKLLPPDLASEAERLERFQREAETLAALNHPHIVTIFSVEEAEGLRFLTMELVEGKSLTKLIPRGGLALPRFFQIAIPLTEAVSAAHEKGITHRDLKPGNVLVTEEDRVKVLDFGLAKLRPEAGATEDSEAPTVSATDAGRVLGTAPYMSPEQAQGKAVDHRSDVFSLGIMLYEMVTGDRPFQGDTFAEVAASILRDTPPAVTERKADLPRDLGKLIKHCLEKEPTRRLQSVLDVRNELEELRREVGTGEALPSSGAPITARRAGGKRRAWLAGGAVVAALTLAVGLNVAGLRDRLRLGEAARGPVEAIAILPLQNLSGETDQEYFADGMTEALIAELGKVGALRVISRTSAMAYKDARKPLPEIAAELNVDAVVEGSVLRSGERVRVRARLVQVNPEEQLWADSYERDLRDILTLQSDVARRIVQEIRVTVTPQEQRRLARARPVDPEAHEAYLRGSFFQSRSSLQGWRQAIDYYEQAIEMDPRYAPAYASLAQTSALLPVWDVTRLLMDFFPKARDAAQTAIELDDTLATAHIALGLVELYYDWDWAAAEREFQRAIELEPGSAEAHIWYGDYLSWMGRSEDGIEEGRHAVELDPLSLPTNTKMGRIFYFAHRYDEAIEQLKMVLDMDPSFWEAHHWLSLTYVKQERFEDALITIQKRDDLEGGTTSILHNYEYAHLYALWGKRGEALRALSAPERTETLPIFRARVYGALGEMDEAFRLLDQAYEERDPVLVVAKVDPRLDPLRSDPRFQDFLRRMNFPQ
jgi:serine/threonine-protein kinase